MGKINVSELSVALVQKHGLTKREAQQFISSFVGVIRKGVTQDRQVKVKGLGTFKVVEVGARESVNVHTGERISIDSHSKLSFTPDASMKELVNKPFSQFETVVLNEGVAFADMEEPEEPKEPEVQEEQEVQEVQEVSEKPETPDTPEAPETPDTPETPAEPVHKKRWLRWLLWTVCIILGFGVGYYIGTLNKHDNAAAPAQPKAKTEQPAATTQQPAATTQEPAATTDEPAAISEEPAAPSEQPTANNQIPEEYLKYEAMDQRVRLGAYYITGLKQTVTVKDGETLRLLSRRYFGSEPAMVSYLEVYNGITASTKLEPGQEIKIPKLETKASVKRRLKKN